MKLVVDIPKEFVAHYLLDNFKDSLERVANDIHFDLFNELGISGNYEIELIDMLKTAFLNAEVVYNDLSTFNEREHYKKAFESVDYKYHDYMLNCLKIFYSNDCNLDSVKDYLLTMLKCGLINCIDLGHVFFVFIFTLHFNENELDFLLGDLKKQLNKKE